MSRARRPQTAPRALRALTLAAALGATSLLAQAGTPGVDEPPQPGTPRPLQLPRFEEATLPNGVRVVVAPRHELPLVTVALHLRLGAAADPDGQAGLSAMTADLRTKGAQRGARRVGATELARQAEALGSPLGAASDWRGTTLSMTVAAPQLDAAAALVVDATLHPLLSGEELDRLREQSLDALQFSLKDPMGLAGLVARRAAWGGSVFGGQVTPASLGRIHLADVQQFHRRQLRPELATLLVAGDVSLEQATALARRLLGSWKSHRMALPTPRNEPPSPAVPATVLIDLPGAGQSGVVVMAPSVPLESPERRVAQVAGAVLGGGYSARLNQEVRVKRGLSYGASSGTEFQPVAGLLSARTQTKHPSAAEVATLMRGEITGLAQRAPTPEELSARQAALVGAYGRGIETNEGLAQTALDLIGRGRPLAEAARFAPEVLAVTPQQVQDFAARHWSAGRLRTVIVGDLAAGGEALKALDADALRLEARQLDLDQPGLRRQP